MKFTDMELDPRLQKNLRAIDFTRPTPIQSATIPAALEGRDILGSAETGTGKTAAFMLPILQGLLDSERSRSPRALILTPTRELALQIAEHGAMLSKGLPVSFITVFGGVGMKPQIDALKRGVDIVIATPGRLLDMMRRGHARFDRLETLVLDEADRMLDIGFLPDITRIVREIPKDRQTMLFSATIAPIYGLARDVTRNAKRVEVEKAATPDGIDQAFFPVLEHRKPEVLAHLLEKEGLDSVLVFTRTKRRADRIVHTLTRRGMKARVIHGDRTQDQRFAALEAFRDGRTRILVATDVAARGIDVTGISHVVNYDAPRKADDYVHRIGRTGRADATGCAWTLVAPQDEAVADQIQRVVKTPIERRSVEGMDTGRPAELKKKTVQKATKNGWRRPSTRRGRMRAR